jgi:hypothetical protein
VMCCNYHNNYNNSKKLLFSQFIFIYHLFT